MKKIDKNLITYKYVRLTIQINFVIIYKTNSRCAENHELSPLTTFIGVIRAVRRQLLLLSKSCIYGITHKQGLSVLVVKAWT